MKGKWRKLNIKEFILKAIEEDLASILLEQDYELTMLYHALEEKDNHQINKSKNRLVEINIEITKLNMRHTGLKRGENI